MRRESTRVAVIDNETAFRAGIRHALGDPRFELIADGATLQEIESLEGERAPEVAIVDELVWASVNGDVRLPCYAVLVREPSVATLIAVLATGAMGCISRDVALARLPLLVEDLASGYPVVPPQLTAALIEQATGGSRSVGPQEVKLTRRQTQILTLIEEGLRDLEIADLLGLSPVTVRRHLSDLSARIGSPARRLQFQAQPAV
jgi:DNA-binding NarL/FixJ family response regulator